MISGCRQRFSDVIPHGDGVMKIPYISVSASQGLHMNFIVLHLAMVLTIAKIRFFVERRRNWGNINFVEVEKLESPTN